MSEQSTLLELILAGQLSQSLTVLEDEAKKRGYQNTITEVLEPALVEIGKSWEREDLSLAAGYLAGKVAESFIESAATHNEDIPSCDGVAVIGNIEDDYHALGRKLIGIFLQAAGWKVIDLGNDVSAHLFVETAIEQKAHVIGASAMMFTTAQNILQIRTLLDKKGLSGKIKLAAGGAVFNIRRDLLTEVGADGTARNAVEVPDLFMRLKNEILV
jgi:methylmalonyl-CoA mutase cobalamin-binding domain/chain